MITLPVSVRHTDLPEKVDGRVIISNSEVMDYLKCERKHLYAHAMKIRPKSQSSSLSRGIIGHEALAEYYANDRDEAKAFKVIDSHAVAGTADLDMLTGLRNLLAFYFTFHADDDKLFRILEVEKPFYMDLGEDYSYGMRLDLLVEMISGPYAGEKIIVDHKFQYNFPTADDLTMNAQLPKYIGTVRNSGVDVKRGMLNILRWRVTKANELNAAERFKREYIAPSPVEIRNIMREQVLASERIADRKAMGVEAYKQVALRALNGMTCKNCPFINICKTELVGENAAVMIATEFVQNEYGYVEDGE